MKSRSIIIKKAIAWLMLIIMGINNFGNQLMLVHAAEYDIDEYEKASEEAEEEIRNAEKNAGIPSPENEGISDDNETENSGLSDEEFGDDKLLKEETVQETYEDMTISGATTLNEDLEVDNLIINSTLHVNGHRIIVHGDLTINSYLYMEEGYVNVKGDLSDERYSRIITNSINDYILIEGNYYFLNAYYDNRTFNYGTLEIWGDVIENKSEYSDTQKIFDGSSKVILSGSTSQTIDMGTKSGWYIKNLIVNNTSDDGVVSKHMLNAYNIDDKNNKLTYESEGNRGFTLTEDLVIDGDYTLLSGELDLAGYSLTINGDLIHAGGWIIVNGGNLIIKGNYKKQYSHNIDEETEIENSAGILVMDNDADCVLIEKDYIDAGIINEFDYLKAGVLEIRGNIMGQDDLYHYLLQTQKDHVIKITGDDKQMIETGSLFEGGNYSFANMIIDQHESGSVLWDSTIVVTGSVKHSSNNINGLTMLGSDTQIDSEMYGNIALPNKYSLKKDVVFNGDLYLGYDTAEHKISIIDSQVTVNGDCYVYRTTIESSGENGKISVKGDVKLKYSYFNINSGILEVCGNIEKDNSNIYLACRENAEVRMTGSVEQHIDVSNNNTIITNIIIDNPEGVVVGDNTNILNITCLQGVLSYASGGVHGFTLEEDSVYDGDLEIDGGTLNLNGHTLHVKGNLTIAAGSLTMINSLDHLIVDGDFLTKTSVSHNGKLTDGILELKGDFTQQGSNYSYTASGNHTTIFSGTDEQVVSFQTPYNSFFHNVTFSENSKVTLNNYPRAYGMISQNGVVSGVMAVGGTSKFQLNKYSGDILFIESYKMSDDLSICGNVEISYGYSLDINTHFLNIEGQLSIENSYSYVLFNHGTLQCNTLMISQSSGSGIRMNYSDDKLIVSGDISITGKNDITSEPDSVVILNGTEKQTITMNGNYHKFGKVIINNTSDDGIYITDSLNCSNVDNTTGCNVVFADGGILGYTLQDDEIIDGDLIISGGVMKLNGHKLKIKGNLTCNVGVSIFDAGILSVDGDFINNGALSLGEGTLNIGGNWNINGNVTSVDSEINIAGDINSDSNYKTADFRKAKEVNFTGKSKQTITYNSGYLYLYNVCVDNAEGIGVSDQTNVCFCGNLTTNNNPIEGWVYLYGTITDASINANVCFLNDSLLDSDLVVNGDVEIGCVKLKEHRLTIFGTTYFTYKSHITGNSSKGILEIKGDFKRGRMTSNYYTFGNDIDIILSGDDKQIIDFNSYEVNIHKLIISNTSEDGVLSNSLFNVDIIDDPGRKLKFKEEGEVGYTLTKDTVIQGDMTILIGEMNLNGYKLTILGNLNHIGGIMKLNGGELHVCGNYVLAKKNEDESYSYTKGSIQMSDESEHVYIDGDLMLYCNKAIINDNGKGTVDIKGDIISNSYNSVVFPQNIILIFSGNAKQIISGLSMFGFGIIQIDNTSPDGVILMQEAQAMNKIINCNRLHGMPGKTLYWYNTNSPEFNGFEGDLYIKRDVVLNGDISVDGLITVSKSINVNGYNITTGDMIANYPVTLNGGILRVKNNLVMSSSYSKLIMNNDDDILQVTGNINVSSGYLTLNNGHTDIKGNVNITTSNYTIGKDHTTTLSGKINSSGKAYTQTVTVPANFKFNKLVLTKPRDYYVFSRDVEDMCAELIEDVQDITPPEAPTGLVAAEVNYTSVKLTWDASNDDTGVAGYDIYRNDKKIMSVTGTSYTDKKLTPGMVYNYYVVAKDATLNTSAYSKTLSVSTLADTVAPSVPTGILLSERCGTTLTVQYNASADNVSVAGYHIYRDGELVGDSKVTSYTDSSLEINHEYKYQVSSYDVSGNESELSDEVEFYTQAVEVSDITPGNYSDISGKEAEISVFFANAGSVNGYKVYMAYTEDGSDEVHELLNKTCGKNTSYRSTIIAKTTIDTTAISSEEINLTVRVTDAGGYEYERNYTYYLDKSAPGKLSQTGAEVRNGVAVISFEKAKESDIAGYRIYRQEAEGEIELFLESPTPDKTYYYDKTVITGTEYTYYVSAYDEEGQEGELSKGMTVTIGADDECPRIESVTPLDGTLTGTEKIIITASDNKALNKLIIERVGNGSDEDVMLDETDMSSGKAEYEIDTTQLEKEITLRFTVSDVEGNTNDGEFICTYSVDNEGPDAPTGISTEIYSTTAVLSWDAPSEDDYDHTVIEQIEEGGNRKEVARTTTTTGCVIEGLTPLETTTYQVTFYDKQGNAGTPSELISVTADEDTILPRILSMSPQGGYCNNSISLSINAYDNCAVESVYIDYSSDKTTWENIYTYTYDTPEKQPVCNYDLDTSELPEGEIYIRAYASDAAGNTGDKEQVIIQYIVDHTSPAAVDKLTVSGEKGSIFLKWNEPVDNDVAGYRLFRSVEGINSYTCINSSINTLSYYDRSAAYDTSYCYRLTAYDFAGNESEMSDTVIAQKQDDDEKPVVYSIIPEQNVMIAKTVKLSAYVADNDKVTNVEFAIRSHEEGSTKIVLETVSADISSGTVTCSIDSTLYTNGDYDILVTATDRSGNISSEFTSPCIIHNVSLDIPELYAIAGDWCVNLHCTLAEPLTYTVYRRCQQTEETYTAINTGKGTFMFRDIDIDPKYTYIYQVMIEDEAGNSNKSVLRYVKPNAVDSIAPVAVINTNTSVVEEYETVFSGMDSTDNDRIVRYTWDFGDGSDEMTGPSPKHTYKKAGNYIAKLTVEDASGNTGYDTAKITVLPKQSAGKAVVSVRNASGSPVRDVMIYVNSSTTGNDMVRTDNKGQAVIMQKPGTYKIALYKQGYVATEESVEIELYGERDYSFIINEGETITADFTVRQMDFDEIVAAGIDLFNPANQHVFTVQTTLKFEDATRTPEVISEPMIPAKASVNNTNKGAGNAEGFDAAGGTYIAPDPVEGEPDEPEPDLYYTIIINQSISWLKDMYEATLIVYNNAGSQTIVAKDLTATLQLPSGLSLAATKQGQSMTAELPDIKGGETCSTTWYVRGDSRGTYSINAMLKGTLQPFGADFTCNFTSNEFEVTAGEGLVLTIQPEDRAEKDEPYYVYFTLSNEGSKEFYNVKTTFGTHHANSKRFITDPSGSKPLPVMSQDDVVMIECLKPGESISGIYKTILPIKGDKWLNYKKLVDAEYEVLSGENLGVQVVLSVVSSHVAVPALVYQMPTQENTEADPVNVSTGAYTDSISALSVNGVNPVSADLTYDSNATSDLGEFGYGWSHNYETRLKDMKDGTIRYYVSPTGYYTFLASHYDADNIYTENKDGYYELDLSKIPMEETFKCLNENKAGYELERDKNGKFTLTDKAGNITHFDKKGNLTSIANKEGKGITVLRQEGSFTVIDNGTERHLTYNLDKDTKLITSVTDGNREVFFYYDDDRCLKQFVNAAGESTYYTYDDLHRITTVTNEDNVTYVTNTYEISEKAGDADLGKAPSASLGAAYKTGRVKSQKDALGNVTKFAYEENEKNGNLTTTVTTRGGAKKETVTDPYGNVISQTNEAGSTITTTYDDNGNETYVNQPEMTTVDGKKTSYTLSYKYDSDGNMLSMSNSMLEEGEDEAVMAYDAKGNMTSMKNRNGESMECTYYDNGQIKTVKDQNGNVITYKYNDNGQILSETDGNNKSISYEYRNGDLISVTDRNGNVTTYTYNAEGLVEKTTIKDKISNEEYTTTNFYDDLNRTSMVLDTEGGTTFYEYDCNGNIIEKTEPSGSRIVYEYDGNNQMIKESVYPDETAEEPDSVTSYSYTKEGLLKTVTDDKSGTVITNSYDKVGNKTKEIEKKGDKRLSETHYAYDELGNMIEKTSLIIDAKGNDTGSLTTQYIYYPNSKLNKVIDYTGAETTYSYDKSWRTQTVESTTEPKITYEYDPAGRVTCETIGETNGNIFNNSEAVSTSYEYDIHGHVTKTTDAKGNSTQYIYDANGNLIETVDATGRVAYSKYDSLNRVIETGIRKSGTTEDISLARTEYSIKNHTVTTIDMVCGGSVTTYYDAAGRQVKTVNGDGAVLSETIYDTENRILQTVDAKGMVSENVYNSLGQIEKVNEGAKGTKNSDGTYSLSGDIHTESYEYDDLGRTNKVTDADNGVSSVVFDSLGRIVSLKDPNQNAADAEGRTWSVNNGNTYTYEYNDKGLLSGETNSLNNVTTYEYNARMLLDTMTDSANEETMYEYDALNRLKEVKDDLGTISYEYDANGNVLEVSEKEGLLSQKKTITRTYDELNRVTSYTDYKGREVKYGYDELGNMIELTYPGGEVVRYTYNPNGTVATMSSNSGGTFTYGYDNYGRLCRISRPDGSVEERTYDNAGQLTEQVDKDKDGNVLQNNIYKYDVFGEITEKTTGSEGDLTRLVNVAMEYDSANRLTKYNGEDVIYDVKGNMTYGPVDGKMAELTYDCRNRLVSAGNVSYTYDCENTRIATEEGGITTEYVTDTGGSLSRLLIAYENIGTANTSETHYYYGAEGLAAQVSIEDESSNSDENTTTGGQYFAYHYDNIGSTTLVTDKTGRIVEKFAYGTYGELLTEVVNNIRFLYNGSYGVVTDSNGLYYMRARYYNPDIKRFINQDIKVGDITNGQGLNRYAYCEGNPVSMVDPFGLCGENANDQTSKYQWLHNALDIAGLFFDGADVINAGVYALEGRWGEAAVSLACALPAIGTAIAGVSKATKLAKAGNIIGQTMKYAGKAYMTVQTATQALELAGDAKVQYAVNGGKLTWDIAKKAVGAAALGALSVMSAGSLMKDVTSLTKMSDVEFHTTSRKMADEGCGKWDDNGFPMCFVAGTKVKTSEGDKDIEDIEEGDYVLSENPDTGEQEYKKVLQTFVNEKRTLVHVYIEDEEIITTDGHPFYVEGVGFVPAQNLQSGDVVRLSDGRKVPVIIIEIEYLDEPVYVYNFEVEDSHTYYVSEIGVLVHNTKCGGDSSAEVETIAMSSKAGKGGSDQLLLEKTPTRRELAEQKLAEAASGINNKTIDSRTNMEIGRFIGDDRGNVFIEPVGGTTVPAGRNGVDTHTLYPNGSNYNRYNPVGHGNNTTPHGHGHLMGTGPGRRGQGPSIDVLGNVVPFNSPDAHWTIH